MSDSIPTPGKSLESDLRLIREARGLSREDIFNRVHIRPEVLAQVEEHGFSATPTLNSDIHRRSFVKHYADAVGIDSQIALGALEKSVNGLYDGVLAVEYLGLDELKPIPRWATTEDTADEETIEPVVSEPESTAPDLPDFDLPTAETQPVFPVPEPEESIGSAVEETSESEVEPSIASEMKGAETAEANSAEPSNDSVDGELAPEEPVESEVRLPKLEVVKPIKTEPGVVEPELPQPELESGTIAGDAIEAELEAEDHVDAELEAEASVDAGLKPEEPVGAKSEQEEPVEEESEAEEQIRTDAEAIKQLPFEQPSPYAPPVGGRPPAPPARETPVKPPTPAPEPGEYGRSKLPDRREAATIPSSTLKESHIGPLEDGDLGDEESSILVKVRGRHWLAWLGLASVIVIILFFVGRAIYLNWGEEETSARRVQTVAQLPSQFSGIVRLTPTTERFVTLQISPDSASPSEFEYKMWTHNAGSTYAETGVGSLNTTESQILLGEPYGIGGLFVLENGRYRLRSVRRVRFPRWEFTGQTQ